MAKNDRYRQLIKNSGCEEALCDVLIKLDKLRVKPDDPVEFIREHLGNNNEEHSATAAKLRELEVLYPDENVAGEKLRELAVRHPELYEKFLLSKAEKARRMKKRQQKTNSKKRTRSGHLSSTSGTSTENYHSDTNAPPLGKMHLEGRPSGLESNDETLIEQKKLDKRMNKKQGKWWLCYSK